MNHIQFIPLSTTEAEIIGRHGFDAMGKPGCGWWASAEQRTFAGVSGPNEVSFGNGPPRTLLLASLGIDELGPDSTHLVMAHQHLAMAASRLRMAHVATLDTHPWEDTKVDDLIDAMSEAVCAALVNYCTHVLITIN